MMINVYVASKYDEKYAGQYCPLLLAMKIKFEYSTA
jgi:hypothetical protein